MAYYNGSGIHSSIGVNNSDNKLAHGSRNGESIMSAPRLQGSMVVASSMARQPPVKDLWKLLKEDYQVFFLHCTNTHP